MKIYEIFAGNELVIAEKVQQRRYQMLIHSCIYYTLNQNVISDAKWNEWAVELRELQRQYPEISKQVPLYEYFADWDGSTGVFLPLDLDWVNVKAVQLIELKKKKRVTEEVKKLEKSKKRRLF